MERKSFSSLIRAFLSAVLVISLMPAIPQSALADDLDKGTVSDLAQAAADGADENDAMVSAASGVSQDASSMSAKEQRETGKLGFVYFGEGSPIAGSIQQIAIAIDDDALTVESAKLIYEDPRGTKHEVVAENHASSAALFSLCTEGAGTYRLIELEAHAKNAFGEMKIVAVDLAKEGENCSFETRADEGTTLSAQSDEDASTLSVLADAGDIEVAGSLDEAAALAGATSVKSARSGKFVIALDPGHGGNDPGAVANGLNEADINWKIAQACKTELEKYANVEVYVTRGENESLSSLSARVERAVEHGAKVFVSIHINSASAAAKGAEVWYPNDSSYDKANTHAVGKELSQKILDELVALGLSDRGIKTKDSANGSKYPDGSVRDYYGVIASSREKGIPGIIVEHAFITNANESKKLADDAFLVQLGQADARGIAKTFDLSKAAGSWEKQANGTYKYKNLNGTYAASTWITEGKTRYWIDENGIMATGVRSVDGTIYYFAPSGAQQAKSGWQQVGDAWYYFGKSGTAQTGWLKLQSKWYYLNPADGKMATGWVDVAGKKYFLNSSGAMRTGGWFQQGGNWYWITSSGAAKTGWQKVKNKWYYLNPADGKMATSWTIVNEEWYYLDPSNGGMKTGWFKQGSTWYYLKGSGAMATGWQTVGSKRYYFDESGKMLTGEQTVDGQRCFFEPSSGAFVGNGTPIMGVSKVTAAKMTTAYLASGKTYPAALAAGGAPDPAAFCKIIEEEANAEGVRAEVVWAQVMWETGWLQMGNDVHLSQYNFAGLGATGNGVAGAVFPDVRTGIRAQVQHLKCYASTEPLNNAKVDPRWSQSLRGKAKLVEWLGIPENPNGTGWAASKEYGYNLQKLMLNKLGV